LGLEHLGDFWEIKFEGSTLEILIFPVGNCGMWDVQGNVKGIYCSLIQKIFNINIDFWVFNKFSLLKTVKLNNTSDTFTVCNTQSHTILIK
jgi:hypothetical protein